MFKNFSYKIKKKKAMKITQNTQCFNFETFFRSNQDTCLSQRPLIKQGQWIGRGQLLADSITSVKGDLALGKNVLIAYMPWEGYNFEDSIVISDRLIAEDVYTSIHVLRFRTEVVNNLSTSNNKSNLDSSHKTATNSSLLGDLFSHSTRAAMANTTLFKQAINSLDLREEQASSYTNGSLLQQFCNKHSNKQVLLFKNRKFFISNKVQQKNRLERATFLERSSTKGNKGCMENNSKKRNCLSSLAKRFTGQKVADKIKSRSSYASFGSEKSKASAGSKAFLGRKLSKARKASVGSKGFTSPLQTKHIPLAFSTCKQKRAPLKLKRSSVVKTPKTQRRLNENRHAGNVETRTSNIPFLGDHLLSHLDQGGIAKVGSWVSPGDILVGKVRPLANKLKSNRASTQLAWEIVSSKKNESINVEDKSFRLPKGVSGRVIRTEILQHSSNEQVHIYLAVKRKVQVGDKLAGRHGNKGIVSLVLPRQDMPYLADGTPLDIILSPLGVPSRMNVGQIYECLLGLAAKSLVCNFKVNNSMATLGDTTRLKQATNRDCFASNQRFAIPSSKSSKLFKTNASLIKDSLDSKNSKDLKDGFTRAYKSTIAPLETRINSSSSIYNVHMKRLIKLLTKLKHNTNNRKQGLTRKQIKDQNDYYIGTRLIKGSTAVLSKKPLTINFLNKSLNDFNLSLSLMPLRVSNSKLKTQQDKQLLSYSNLQARNLVFLKLYQSRITCNKKWLFSLTNPGKIKLFDGRTGQPFSSWVTVGYAYMLKLIHLVDNKIHSRSTGPYSLMTRQAVTGKARQGGQRIGEMEAWAIEGFGAAYTLQEFFSFKGDDVSSRHQWQINSLSKLVGNSTAFKTFLSELRALCISLEFTGFTEGV